MTVIQVSTPKDDKYYHNANVYFHTQAEIQTENICTHNQTEYILCTLFDITTSVQALYNPCCIQRNSIQFNCFIYSLFTNTVILDCIQIKNSQNYMKMFQSIHTI